MLDMDTDTGMGENPGAVLRRLRHTAGRRLSQEALATLLGTSRAHIARLELHGSPQLTDEQLDRLEKASDAVRPPFSRDEIDELRKAMQAVGPAAIEQADKAVQDLAARAGQIFGDHPGERKYEDPPPAVPDPFVSSSRPMFLTTVTQAVTALQEDLEHLIRQRRARQPSLGGAEPDVVLAWFERNLAEEAEDPEKLRDALRELLRRGGTAEILMAASAGEASEDLIALVPPFIAYLGQGGNRYRVRVIDEPRHPLAYDICIVGDRALLIVRGPGGRTAVARTNDPRDVTALRDLLRPYRENRGPIIEEVGRRSRESVTSLLLRAICRPALRRTADIRRAGRGTQAAGQARTVDPEHPRGHPRVEMASRRALHSWLDPRRSAEDPPCSSLAASRPRPQAAAARRARRIPARF